MLQLTGKLTPRNVSIVVGAAILLRVILLAALYFAIGDAAFLSEDSRGLVAEATAVWDGQSFLGFWKDDPFDPTVMPLSLLIMAFTTGATGGLIGYLLVQAVFDAFTCVLIGMMAEQFSPSWFLPAGFLAAINPTQIVLSGMVLTDSLFFFFATAALLFLLRACNRNVTGHRSRDSLLLGLGLGFAALTRTAIIPWIPLAFVILLVARNSGKPFMNRIRDAGVAGLVVAMFLSPVLYRNYQRFDAVGVSPQAGAHLLYWVVPLVAEMSGAPDIAAIKDDASRRLKEESARMPEGGSVFERDAAARKVAITMIKEYGLLPLIKSWVYGIAMNLGIPVVAISPAIRALPHSSFFYAKGNGVTSKVLNYLLAPENRIYVLAVIPAAVLILAWIVILPFGLWRLFRISPGAAIILILWFGYILAINGPVVSPKYRLPLENVWIVAMVAGLIRPQPEDALQHISTV